MLFEYYDVMKTFSFLAISVLIATTILSACGGGGSTASDTTTAAGAAILAAPLAISSALPKIDGGAPALTKASHIPSSDSGFTCSSPVAAGAGVQRVTCTCPRGGTVTVDFTDPSVTGTCPRTIASASSTVYNACVVDVCGRRTTLQGEVKGSVESRRSEVSTLRTADACAGLTATPSGGGTVDVGFDIVFTDNGVSSSFTGNICLNGSTTSFANRDEFERALDPSGACDLGDRSTPADCGSCVADCVADGSTDASCRASTCAFLCGELDCSAADNAKCQDAVESLAPAGLAASYRSATRCVERTLPGPCVIDCTQADPGNFDRCADIFDGLPDSLTTFGCGCFGPPTQCDFTYQCASTAECTADTTCSITSGDPPPPPSCN